MCTELKIFQSSAVKKIYQHVPSACYKDQRTLSKERFLCTFSLPFSFSFHVHTSYHLNFIFPPKDYVDWMQEDSSAHDVKDFSLNLV
ncbi:unnamed protein product [Trifolium pratense]|uniref:Uncharacterized protein n=1 Tax=Trifolium pratense TaxID=57577 RepID=A0ACB0KH56_TRIPR|nr:unnamed protein product [Trifolium pratense]